MSLHMVHPDSITENLLFFEKGGSVTQTVSLDN